MKLTPEELAAIETTVRVAFGEYGYMRTNTVERLLAHIDELQAECDGLRAALQSLVAKLDLVHGDESYRTVWTMYHVHGGTYHGPTYDRELFEAREALNRYGHSQGGLVTARPKKGQSDEAVQS